MSLLPTLVDLDRPAPPVEPELGCPSEITGDVSESTQSFLESLTLCVMEVLAGVRDLDQVARWVSDDVYTHLTQRVVLSARARQVKGDRTIRPTFTIGRTVQSEPAPGVVEGVVIVHGKARSRAVALRLERLNSRWRASAINVL